MTAPVLSIGLQAVLALFALIAWATTVDTSLWDYRGIPGGSFESSQNAFVAFFIISWLLSMAMIVYYIVGLNKSLGWMVEGAVAAVMFIVLLIVSSVWANKYDKSIYSVGNTTAGLVFGFFTTFGWLVVIPLALMNRKKEQESKPPQQETPKATEPANEAVAVTEA